MSDLLSDPLGYPGYAELLSRAARQSGVDESVAWKTTEVAGVKCVSVTFTFEFMGGSMGEASGRRLVEAIDHATACQLPLLTQTRTGGARIQEGIRALVQMCAVTQALERARRVGVPHIAVAADPTTGGVWASLCAGADVIIAVADATVAFAGQRVRGCERATDDQDVFLAQGKFRHGFVDAVAAQTDVGRVVARYLRVLDTGPGRQLVPCPVPVALGGGTSSTGWQAVLHARAGHRPRAEAYLDSYFETRVPISGDRVGGHDPAMLCGLGLRDGAPVAFAAQTGKANTAAGYRTANRLLALANNLRIPVLTLVDTPGAASDAQAEREGIGTAIQQTLVAISNSTSPVTTLVIGEGGSGGALALCAPGHTWITPDAYFSVISPEGAAAILHRDIDQAPTVADRLRITPKDAVDLGLAVGVVNP